MKKAMKKLFMLVASFAMVLSLVVGGTVVKAENETGTITINATSGGTLDGKKFDVYQLMTATKEGDNYTYTLNDAWVNDILAATDKTSKDAVIIYLNDLAARSADANSQTSTAALAEIRAFADALREKTTGKTPYKTVEVESGSTYSFEADYGYYLIVEQNATTGATSLCMLSDAAPTSTITLKSDYPEVVKKVKEDVSYTADGGYGEGYNDVADYDIGDTVPFQFYSEVPDMTGYSTYKFVFHDKMSAGLTFNADSVVVKVGDETLVKDTDYTVSTSTTDGCTFEVTINDLKNYDTGDKVIVSYNATLNSDAIIGYPGNPNAVKLEYSSNPYDSNETNTTTWDNVVVFTFKTTVNKVDKDGNKLDGAEFKLYSDADCTNEIKVTKDANGYYYVNPNGTDTITSVADENSYIVINGLDTGTYYLKETVAPTGYDLLNKPIKIEITTTYSTDRQNWTSNTENAITSVTDDLAKAILTSISYSFSCDNSAFIATNSTDATIVNVINYVVGTLPETGGMGTHVFYIAGGVLMLLAVVIFIKNKKENEN